MTCVPSVWRRRATSKPRAPSNAYDANADESRYLLGRDHRATHEAAFLAKSESLYGMKGVDLPSYEPRLADTWKAYRADHEDKRFTGELRRELDNITFPGERAAAGRDTLSGRLPWAVACLLAAAVLAALGLRPRLAEFR
ncbi:hypothetical protein OHB11_35650 [Streptomyces zaomyceticus]|uniref:hypothetical protein n=1 Tax=Streptomyces zaomyceticus TaxID=68286 RepID=UPI002E10175F|nr:hypothetical protein OG237_04215 [Streptomyces zaomyceticus]